MTETSDKLDKLAPPRMSTTTLELRNRYFAVTDGNLFSYYPITYDLAVDKPIIRFTKTPPVLLEGYAIIEKKIYRVTSEDILRKVIRKSREVTLESINGTSTTTDTSIVYDTDLGDPDTQRSNTYYPTAETSTLIRNVVQKYNEQRTTIGSPTVEVSETADATWSDQIGALLHYPDEEEVFEVGETWEIENLA